MRRHADVNLSVLIVPQARRAVPGLHHIASLGTEHLAVRIPVLNSSKKQIGQVKTLGMLLRGRSLVCSRAEHFPAVAVVIGIIPTKASCDPAT